MEIFNGHPLAGSPRGTWEAINDKRTIARYRAVPEKYEGGKSAVILLYDQYGLGNKSSQEDNAKYLADIWAEQFGLPVYVPDYSPTPVKPPSFNWADPDRGYLRRFVDYFVDLKFIVTEFVPLAGLEGNQIWNDRIKAAVLELASEGYTDLHVIGYFTGADLAVQLLADSTPAISNHITSGVFIYPRKPNLAHAQEVLNPACWLIRPTALHKPAHQDLPPFLKARSEAGRTESATEIQFHTFDGSLRGPWGLPFFFVDKSSDPLRNNADVVDGNRANVTALTFLRGQTSR